MKHGPDGFIQTQSYTYSGNWNYNKMHGEGVFTDDVGKYEGSFQGGYKNGYGQLYYNDGKIFRGYFDMNSPVKGELTLEDGTRLDGDWRSDSKFSGGGTISFPNGDHF
jgi:hypothetical protein